MIYNVLMGLLGFALALVSIATVREVLGAGGFVFGEDARLVLGDWFPRWGVMSLPPGAFFTFGILLAAVNWFSARRRARTDVLNQGEV